MMLYTWVTSTRCIDQNPFVGQEWTIQTGELTTDTRAWQVIEEDNTNIIFVQRWQWYDGY